MCRGLSADFNPQYESIQAPQTLHLVTLTLLLCAGVGRGGACAFVTTRLSVANEMPRLCVSGRSPPALLPEYLSLILL